MDAQDQPWSVMSGFPIRWRNPERGPGYRAGMPGNCRQFSVETQSLRGLSEDQKLGLPCSMALDRPQTHLLWWETPLHTDNWPRVTRGPLLPCPRGVLRSLFSQTVGCQEGWKWEAPGANHNPCGTRMVDKYPSLPSLMRPLWGVFYPAPQGPQGDRAPAAHSVNLLSNIPCFWFYYPSSASLSSLPTFCRQIFVLGFALGKTKLPGKYYDTLCYVYSWCSINIAGMYEIYLIPSPHPQTTINTGRRVSAQFTDLWMGPLWISPCLPLDLPFGDTAPLPSTDGPVSSSNLPEAVSGPPRCRSGLRGPRMQF